MVFQCVVQVDLAIYQQSTPMPLCMRMFNNGEKVEVIVSETDCSSIQLFLRQIFLLCCLFKYIIINYKTSPVTISQLSPLHDFFLLMLHLQPAHFGTLNNLLTSWILSFLGSFLIFPSRFALELSQLLLLLILLSSSLFEPKWSSSRNPPSPP